MRRAVPSKPLVLSALRLAASISPCMVRATSSRVWKPSATGAASGVPWYMEAISPACRSSMPGLDTPAAARAVLGTS